MDREKCNGKLKLNVNVITWNLAGINVTSLSLLFNSKSLEGVDIISFGVQECSIFKINNWEKEVKFLLNYYNFVEIATIKMFQMFLIVFIRKDLWRLVEKVESYKKPMGLAKII